MIAISIDIKNAFNSIDWGEIKNTIRRNRFPGYLCRVIESYLSEKKIV